MFNWRRIKGVASEKRSDEWPEFTDSLVTRPEGLQQTKLLPGLCCDDARFGPKTVEDIIAAARSVA